jgi:hypothetical protein
MRTHNDDIPTMDDLAHRHDYRSGAFAGQAATAAMRAEAAKRRRAAQGPEAASPSRAVADAARASIPLMRAVVALARLGALHSPMIEGDLDDLAEVLDAGRKSGKSWRDTVRDIAARGCVSDVAPF